MKVIVASRHLAESTLSKKVQVYAHHSDVPRQKGETKAQRVRWVEKEFEVEVSAPDCLHDHMHARREVLEDQQQQFQSFMAEHESRLGITREHLLQASHVDIADGETGETGPMHWLMRMVLAMSDKAEGVLTINQKLAQERTNLNTQVNHLDETNKQLAKENDKVLLKLKELTERLTDQSNSRDIYEKEASTLRQAFTERHATTYASRRVVAEGERIQDNDKKARGPVRDFHDDPEWKNWFMIIKACPKCLCAVAAFPKRTVACSRGCTAKDGAEVMSPEDWNDWVDTYIDPDEEEKKRPEDYAAEGITQKIGNKIPDETIIITDKHRGVDEVWSDETTEVEIPPPDPDDRDPDVGPTDGHLYLFEDRLAEVEAYNIQLSQVIRSMFAIVQKLAKQQEDTKHRDVLRTLEDQVRGDMIRIETLPTTPTLDDLESMDSIVGAARKWGTAILEAVQALRTKNDNPDLAFLQLEAALAKLR